MAEPTTTFRIKALVEGVEGVEALKQTIHRLQSTARPAANDIERLRLAASVLGNTGLQTTNDLRQQVAVLKELRNNVLLGSKAYKQLTEDLRRAELALERINKTGKRGSGQRFQTAATVASAGLFGGPEALIGAGIGAAFGPAGAATGAVAGQVVRGAREAVGGMATYAAEIKRLEIALKGVTKSSIEFNRAQKVIQVVSKELNVPIKDATSDFTKLAASVIGAGGTVRDTEIVFRGVSEAVKATGGDTQDLQSAVRALSQVFGKGKVSAEELQGQLGERLPGAVVKFADATGRTLPQLAKDLRDGTVGLNDVMKFAVKLSKDHRTAALEMAGSTEEAGARMKVALAELRRNFGEFFKPTGAGIQSLIADMANLLNNVISTSKALGMLKSAGVGSQEIVNEAHKMTKAIMETRGSRDSGEYSRVLSESIDLLTQQRLKDLGIISDPNKGKTSVFDEPTDDGTKGTKDNLDALQKYAEKVKDVNAQIKDAVVSTFKKMEDTIVDFVMTGKLAWRDFANSILREMTRVAVRQAIIAPFSQMASNLFNRNANGNVYAQNGIQPFARGGVVDRPTIFPFAGGTGLMGEAGPEAILPLTRRNGKLGVEGGGGGGVVVNVDATGSSIEGNERDATELGKALSVAVQAELIKQQRPGGLLA